MEGPTDYVVLKAAVRALLKGRDFVPTPVRPELNQNLIPTTESGDIRHFSSCVLK